MRGSELRDLSDQELEVKERELKEELFRLRLRHRTAQLEQTHKLVQARRDLARLQTVRRQRQQPQG
jgi:large subunit ribosomal protein L29